MTEQPEYSAPTQQDSAQVDQTALDDLVRHAGRTIGLVGFPDSGKTAYLLALGKELGKPQAAPPWKVVHSYEDVATYAAGLIRSETRPGWERTHSEDPPKRLRMFSARRGHSPFRCELTTFDTSGEHYLAIGEGLERARASERALAYAEAVGQRILPRCPGIIALIDCSLDPEKLNRRVLYYSILFNKVHRFEPEEPRDQAAKPFRLVRGRRRLPVAFAITKVDRLEGREIKLPRRASAYWRYLQAHGRDPAEMGLRQHGGERIRYTIRTEVFLDRRRHPDPAEGQAVIRDFVRCHMSPLADLVENMVGSGAYEVSLFPVSNWGRDLPRDEHGVERRPDLTSITPAGVMEPQFWILERIFQARRRRIWTRTARYLTWAVAALLLLGPGLFWGLSACTRAALERGNAQWAYWSLRLNNAHPYSRYLARRWEPAAVDELVELNFRTIELLFAQRRADAARTLIEQARRLGANTIQIDRADWKRLQTEFQDQKRTASANALARTGLLWIRAGAQLGPGWFAIPVRQVAEALRARKFHPTAWRQFAETVMQCKDKPAVAGDWAGLGRGDLRVAPAVGRLDCRRVKADAEIEAHRFYGRYYLQQGLQDMQPPEDPTDDAQVRRSLQVLRQADSHALRSGDAELLAACHEALVKKNRVIVKALMQMIRNTITTGQGRQAKYETAVDWWNKVLARAREYPTLKHELWTLAEELITSRERAARRKEQQGGDTQETIPDLELAHKLAENIGREAKAVELGFWLAASYLRQANERKGPLPVEALRAWREATRRAERLRRSAEEGKAVALPSQTRLAELARQIKQQLRQGYLEGRFDPRGLRELGISQWEMTLWAFQKHMDALAKAEAAGQAGLAEQASRDAVKALSRGIAAPNAEPAEALRCLSQLLELARRKFTRPPVQPGPLRRLLADIQAAAKALQANLAARGAVPAGQLQTKLAAVLREADRLGSHLERIQQMVLVQPPPGCPVRVKPFYIDRHEVTVGAYETWLGQLRRQGRAAEARSRTPHCWNWKAQPGRLDPADPQAYRAYQANYGLRGRPADWETVRASPVVGVSHEDAAAYARAHGKRLPTLAEWQALAWMLDESLKPDALKEQDCNVNNPAHRPEVLVAPVNVPLKDTWNAVAGIAGNVREWCAAPPGAGRAFVFGASWFGAFPRPPNLPLPPNPNWCRPEQVPTDDRQHDLGFRCALDLLPTASKPSPPVPTASRPTSAPGP